MTCQRKARQGQAMPRPRPRHAKARQGQAMPRPRHDMPTQGKARHGLPMPRHAKLPIASLSRNALNGEQGQAKAKARQSQGKARQSQRNATQGKAMQGNATQGKARQGKANATQRKATQRKATQCKARQGKANARVQRTTCQRKESQSQCKGPTHNMPTQGSNARVQRTTCQGKARHAKAMPNARQGKYVKIQSVGWVASPSFGGKLNGKWGGGTNRSDAGLNLSGSWQQGHSATYNTPSRI